MRVDALSLGIQAAGFRVMVGGKSMSQFLESRAS